MLPKKNIGAITIMTAFLGLTLTHIITAFIYFSYSKAEEVMEAVQSASHIVNAVGILELLLILGLAAGAALLFVNSDDYHSMGLLGASALLSVMTLSLKFSLVKDNQSVLNVIVFLMNLSVLAIFAIYAIFYSRRQMKQMSLIVWIAGIWVSFLSVGCRAAAARFSDSGLYFILLAVIAVISAVCYFIAYYSQRQSFE